VIGLASIKPENDRTLRQGVASAHGFKVVSSSSESTPKFAAASNADIKQFALPPVLASR
jgi:hypothetical protein